MSEIEREIIKATNFDAAKGYRHRQDYLAALAKSTNVLKDDEYDHLSTETITWLTQVSDSLQKKKTIPEFPDVEVSNAEESEHASDLEASESDNGPEEDFAPEGTGTPYPEPKEKKPRKKMRRQLTGEIDRFGHAVGSRAAQTVALLLEGAPMAKIREMTGQNRYSVIDALRKAGHFIDSTGTPKVFKLTHKDDK